MKRGIKIYPSTVITFILAAFMGVMIWASRVFPFQVGLYVWFAGGIGVASSIFVMVQDIRQALKGGTEITGDGMVIDIQSEYDLSTAEVKRKLLRSCLWILAIYLMTWLLGFKVSIGIFFLSYLPFEGHTRWYNTILLTACALGFLVYFDLFLQAFWPDGILKEWWTWLP